MNSKSSTKKLVNKTKAFVLHLNDKQKERFEKKFNWDSDDFKGLLEDNLSYQ
jgi:hypothetical protein